MLIDDNPAANIEMPKRKQSLPKYLSIDESILHEIGKKFDTIITVEDGVISGGLGSAVLEFMADNSYVPSVNRLGIRDQFVEHGSTKELYQLLKLDKQGICESLLQALEQ